MCSFLKNHPFAVEAFFKHSIVLTFAFPKEELEPLLPDCLVLDTYLNKWAFIAVAIVQTTQLRPKGWPKIFGNDFSLIGYRVFVRYVNNAGKKRRGLYILRSETDKKLMELLGNALTHYNYLKTDIKQQFSTDRLSILSKQSKLNIELRLNASEITLPPNSPFVNFKEARRFAGPLPFTFSWIAKKQEVLIIEGVRENWIPRPVEVISHQVPYLNSIGSQGGLLANAFIIDNIPYYWKKGIVEQWQQ